ncbi:MAG: right-handed parallel beta-helix repeat-containing protein [Deltaproteobacteria bacterium]|nr:right-handed parallel beta-helix repeat-containing protein [Deltaproteobacteria bacterium]
MLWGSPAQGVPISDGWGLLMLAAAFVTSGIFIIRRGPRSRAMVILLVALAVPLTAYAASIGLPHVFVNGTSADATEVNTNFDVLVLESNMQDGRIGALEAGVSHTHPGTDISSQVGDADTVDGVDAADLEESFEIDADITTHSADSSAHHGRYSDGEAFAAVVASGGAGSSLDADLLDGMQASALISAASDEVRTPISSAAIAIVSPGSYYLTGNLDGSIGGIDITTNDVTLDMMGFTLDGTGSTDHGIDVRGSSGVTIQNGKIRGFALAGIYNDMASADVNQVVNVQVLGNGTSGTAQEHSGIYLAGEFNHVEGCTAVGNGGYGIFVGASSTLVDNTGEGISDAGCPSVPPGCPASHALRDATTVYNELQTSLNAQDWTAVACNYATDTFAINDQGVLTGHNDIISSGQSLASLFNGVAPGSAHRDTFDDTVRVLDSLDAGWITMPDRVRTFVVECGIITRSTSHGLIVFTGPPP